MGLSVLSDGMTRLTEGLRGAYDARDEQDSAGESRRPRTRGRGGGPTERWRRRCVVIWRPVLVI